LEATKAITSGNSPVVRSDRRRDLQAPGSRSRAAGTPLSAAGGVVRKRGAVVADERVNDRVRGVCFGQTIGSERGGSRVAAAARAAIADRGPDGAVGDAPHAS